MLPPGCTRSAGLLAPGSTWTSCCDAAAPGDGLPMHTIAMALAQMTECMRAMRGKIDRTDRAVRDVAHRLSSQKRIIERVDRRIVALETRPAQSARHSHHVPRSHSLGSFNCALCGRAGACRAPAARSAPDVRQPAYAPAHAPRQTLSCCYGEDAGGSFFSAPSTVYTCAVGRPQMCGGGVGGGGGAGPGVSCCGFVPRCRGGADCNRSIQSCASTRTVPTTTCTPSCTPSNSQMASSERCCSSISSLGWMCSSSIREAVLSEARADRLGMRMLRAAQRGNLRVVRNLLHMGADANFCTATKWTALHRAAAKGHSSVVTELLANGACVNARNCYGFTPLHTAAYDDYHGKCVKLLVDAGADTGVRNRFGRTALHYAAECGNVAAVKALLRGGASVDARDDAGLTAISLSRTVSVRRMLRACQKKGRRRPCHCPRACKPLCPH